MPFCMFLMNQTNTSESLLFCAIPLFMDDTPNLSRLFKWLAGSDVVAGCSIVVQAFRQSAAISISKRSHLLLGAQSAC